MTNTSPSFSPGFANVNVGLYDAEARKIIHLPDGKILVGGWADTGARDFVVMRFNEDGTLDTSFGEDGNGIVRIDVLEQDEGKDMALDANGNILIVGMASDATQTAFALVRLTPDGEPDITLGPNGSRTFLPVPAHTSANSILVQSDGKIVIGGNTEIPNNTADDELEDTNVIIMRLEADGITIDQTFGVNGVVEFDPSSNGYFGRLTDLVLQNDGKIVGSGIASSLEPGAKFDAAMGRLNADGSFDTSFGDSGVFVDGFSAQHDGAFTLATMPDGRIAVAGVIANEGTTGDDIAVRIYNPDGTVDSTFNLGLPATFDIAAGNDFANTVLIQPDGKIIVGGYSEATPFNYEFAVFRFNADGTPDTSFGNGTGYVVSDFGGFYGGEITSLTFDGSGRILAAGTKSDVSFAVFRLLPDGDLDVTFGGGSSVGGGVQHEIGAAPVVLDTDAFVIDQELDAADDYGGATLTLQRAGGASPDDIFDGSGPLGGLFDGEDLILGSDTIGTVANANGVLTLTFAAGTTSNQVNEVLSSISYRYGGTTPPPAPISIEWTFSDGNTAEPSQPATATVEVNILPDSPLTAHVLDWSDGLSKLLPGLTVQSVDIDTEYDIIFETLGDLSTQMDSVSNLLAGQGETYTPEDSFTITGTADAGPDAAGDSIVTGDGDDVIRPNGGRDSVSTGAGDNVVQLIAQGEDGTIQHFNGNPFDGNTFDGGLGYDTLEVSGFAMLGDGSGTGMGGRVLENFQELRFTTQSGFVNEAEFHTDEFTSPSGIHTVVGSDYIDILEIWGNTAVAGQGMTIDFSGVSFVSWESKDRLVLTGTLNDDSLTTNRAVGSLLSGEGGNDVITGGDRRDDIDGGDGDDWIDGGDGDDVMSGDAGRDTLSYSSAQSGVTVDLGIVGVHQDTGNGLDRLVDSFEILEGSSHDDDLARGGAENVELYGLDGDDTLRSDGAVAGQGTTTFNGGRGTDTVSFETANSKDLVANLATGIAKFGSHPGQDSYLLSIENLFGTGFADKIYGNADANELHGLGGNDTLFGKDGSDALFGGDGADKLYGENDADALFGGDGNDTLYGGAGDDDLYGGEGNDVFYGGAGEDYMNGGDGTGDIAYYTTSSAGVTINLATNVNTGGEAQGDTLYEIERVQGSNHADSITGDAANNSLYGNGGADLIRGGAGADTLYGGADNDRLLGDDDNDTLRGNEGNDTLYGGAGNDVLEGGEGNDVLYGGTGADTLNGGEGTADIVYYNTSTAGITVDLTTNVNAGGDAAGDKLFGVERLQGSQHADSITGNSEGNFLYGNGGDDTIRGHMGADLLYGGAGSDSFVFAAGDSGQTTTTLDQIKDYTKGDAAIGDEIDFAVDLAVGGTSAAASATQASIDALTGLATFATGSGRSLVDALADISASFTAGGDALGQFALFRVNNAGDHYAFISDGLGGVTSTDTVIRLNGVTSYNGIDLSGGDLTLLA